jgi:2-methylcitrate dehydratase
MSCHLKVHLKNGRVFEKEKQDCRGFFTHPMSWEQAVEKFRKLTASYADQDLSEDITTLVATIVDHNVTDLTALLESIPRIKARP